FYEGEGKFDRAEELFKRACDYYAAEKHDGGMSDAQYHLANCLRQNHKAAEAREMWTKILAARNNNPTSTWETKGQACLGLAMANADLHNYAGSNGNFSSAINYFEMF